MKNVNLKDYIGAILVSRKDGAKAVVEHAYRTQSTTGDADKAYFQIRKEEDGSTVHISESTFERWWKVVGKTEEAKEAAVQEKETQKEEEQPVEDKPVEEKAEKKTKATKSASKNDKSQNAEEAIGDEVLEMIKQYGAEKGCEFGSVKTGSRLMFNGKNVCELHKFRSSVTTSFRHTAVESATEIINEERIQLGEVKIAPKTWGYVLDCKTWISKENFEDFKKLLDLAIAYQSEK